MSPPRVTSTSRRRGGIPWVPLALTATVATVGLAFWVLGQKGDDSDSEEEDDDEGTESPLEPGLDYDHADYGENPAYGAVSPRHDRRPSSSHQETERERTSITISGRVQDALRRTPSPQQFFDNAGKRVAAGLAATGAAISNTLAAITEEDKAAFADHETWSEEADAKAPRQRDTQAPGRRRQTVAVVVSADTAAADLDDKGEFVQHASILSYIPKTIDFDRVRFFILIYAPGLKEQTVETSGASNKPPPSLDSSYSKIDPPDMTPGSEKSPINSNAAFNAVQAQALALVEKHTMVLPFTSANGHVHILRHLQPDAIYMQESLSGDNGSVVNHIQTWMKNEICIVVGAEGGHGALADSSESETDNTEPEKATKWWQREDRVGRGRGVAVVDGIRIYEDWLKRVEGME